MMTPIARWGMHVSIMNAERTRSFALLVHPASVTAIVALVTGARPSMAAMFV